MRTAIFALILTSILFPSRNAMAAGDPAEKLVCQGPLGTDPERIYLGSIREIQQTSKSFKTKFRLQGPHRDRKVEARCEYGEERLACNWGFGIRLYLDFSAPTRVSLFGEQEAVFISGELKAGFFRWPAKISCRVPQLVPESQED